MFPPRVLLRRDEGVPEGVGDEDDQHDDCESRRDAEVARSDFVAEALWCALLHPLPLLGCLCDLSAGGVPHPRTEVPKVFATLSCRVSSHAILPVDVNVQRASVPWVERRVNVPFVLQRQP